MKKFKDILKKEEMRRLSNVEYTVEDLLKKINERQEYLEKVMEPLEEYNRKIKLLEERLRKIKKIQDFDNEQYLVKYLDGGVDIVSKDDISIPYEIPDEIKHQILLSSLSSISNSDILEWVKKDHQMPKSLYTELAEDNKPLPPKFYVDHRDSNKAWAQLHFRGIEPDEYKAYKSGKKKLWEILVGQSYHVDLRIDYPGLEKLVQFVITENNIQQLLKTLKGERDKTKSGVLNVHHSKVVSKPSGEPPEKLRYYKAENEYPAIDEEGAKLAEKVIIKEGSYWIEPGNVGSTKNTYAYMSLIWLGRVSTGVERHDYHELFLYKEKAKDNIFNGKFAIKCLKDSNGIQRWEIWKAISNPKPLDPILHSDIGYHYLVPADKVDKLGKDKYREESIKAYEKKLKK